MKPEDLVEAVGLYTRWMKRIELKLTSSEIFWCRYRLEQLGVVLA